MTIPQLIKNYQAKVLQTGLKKSYANISNAYLMTKASLGVSNVRAAFATYNGVEYPEAKRFIDEFYNNLKIMKTYEKSMYPMTNYTKTKTITSNIGKDAPTAVKVLPDGSSVGIHINMNHIRIYVDTNGPYSKPNRLGFDIFEFRVMDSTDQIKSLKESRRYTDEELENETNVHLAGFPCNKNSTQLLNGMGCAWYAVNDVSPEDNSKSYWKNLPW